MSEKLRVTLTCLREVAEGIYEQRKEAWLRYTEPPETSAQCRELLYSESTGRKFAVTRRIPRSVFVSETVIGHLRREPHPEEVVEVWDKDFLELVRFKQLEGDDADLECLFFAPDVPKKKEET